MRTLMYPRPGSQPKMTNLLSRIKASFFQPTCAYAWWAHMHHIPSVCQTLSVCAHFRLDQKYQTKIQTRPKILDQNSDWTKNHFACDLEVKGHEGQGHRIKDKGLDQKYKAKIQTRPKILDHNSDYTKNHFTCDPGVKGPKSQGQIRLLNKSRWAHINVKLLHFFYVGSQTIFC